MRKMLLLLLVLLLCADVALAEGGQAFTGEGYYRTDDTQKYTVWVYWYPDDKPADALIGDIKDLFFTAYPAMRETYGTTEEKEIKIYLWDESAMPENVPAYTEGNKIHCSRQFLEADRGNLNCIVHEMFHVVQGGYPQAEENPLVGALTEGLADVARYEYSVFDDPAWSLAEYAEGQSYMDGYTVTAAFLVWADETYDGELCLRLNRVLHEGCYAEKFWTDVTGHTLDDWWNAYAAQSR